MVVRSSQQHQRSPWERRRDVQPLEQNRMVSRGLRQQATKPVSQEKAGTEISMKDGQDAQVKDYAAVGASGTGGVRGGDTRRSGIGEIGRFEGVHESQEDTLSASRAACGLQITSFACEASPLISSSLDTSSGYLTYSSATVIYRHNRYQAGARLCRKCLVDLQSLTSRLSNESTVGSARCDMKHPFFEADS